MYISALKKHHVELVFQKNPIQFEGVYLKQIIFSYSKVQWNQNIWLLLHEDDKAEWAVKVNLQVKFEQNGIQWVSIGDFPLLEIYTVCSQLWVRGSCKVLLP